MRVIIGTLGLIITGFIVQSFAEWWIIALVAFAFGLLVNTSGTKSFLFGFLGVFLLWGTYAAFLNSGNESILAGRIGSLFGGLNPMSLIIITAVLGGIVGGFSALTGKLGREIIR